MAERSNAAVLKTVDGQLSGGSNPSLSATKKRATKPSFFVANEPNIERDSRVGGVSGSERFACGLNICGAHKQTEQRTPAVCRGAFAKGANPLIYTIKRERLLPLPFLFITLNYVPIYSYSPIHVTMLT